MAAILDAPMTANPVGKPLHSHLVQPAPIRVIALLYIHAVNEIGTSSQHISVRLYSCRRSITAATAKAGLLFLCGLVALGL
jgi:hypothetical protein